MDKEMKSIFDLQKKIIGVVLAVYVAIGAFVFWVVWVLLKHFKVI